MANSGNAPPLPGQARFGQQNRGSLLGDFPITPRAFVLSDKFDQPLHERQILAFVDELVSGLHRLADSAGALQTLFQGQCDDGMKHIVRGRNVAPHVPTPLPVQPRRPFSPRESPEQGSEADASPGKADSTTALSIAATLSFGVEPSIMASLPSPMAAKPSTQEQKEFTSCPPKPEFRRKTLSQIYTVRPAWCELSDADISVYEQRYRLSFNQHSKCSERQFLVDWDPDNPAVHPLRAAVFHPNGPQRIAWNVICLFLISYDIIFVPLQAFDLPENLPMMIVEWLSTLCWTFDVPISFRTGYYDGSTLEMSPDRIARRYAKTWLPLDIFIVALEWGTRFTTALPDGSSLIRTTRILRILRCVRLLRLTKLKVLWGAIEDQVNSNVFLLCFMLMKMSLILVVVTHALACTWYALGKGTLDGWASYYAPNSKLDRSLIFWYFASSRWTLAQINGRTDQHELRNVPELIYSCIVAVCFPIVFMIVFQSSITTTMIELTKVAETRTRAKRLVNTYLKKRHVSMQLTGNVKQHLASEAIHIFDREEHFRVLELLPPHLAQDLLYEVRQPVLCMHGWFRGLNREFPRAMRHVSHAAVRQIWTRQREVIFERGDACNRMLFVESGLMRYQGPDHCTPTENAGGHTVSSTPTDALDTSLPLIKGQWISEPALWVEWANRGRMEAGPKGCLLSLEATELAKFLREYRSAYAIAVLYAKDFIQSLQHRGSMSDIMDTALPIPCTSLAAVERGQP